MSTDLTISKPKIVLGSPQNQINFLKPIEWRPTILDREIEKLFPFPQKRTFKIDEVCSMNVNWSNNPQENI